MSKSALGFVTGLALVASSVGQVLPAVSFPSFGDLQLIGATNVVAPDESFDVNFRQPVPPVNAIPADGNYHMLRNIVVNEFDPYYDYTLTQLEITSPGFVSGGVCSPAFDYRLSSGGDLLAMSLPFTGPNVDTLIDLQLSIPPSGTETGCVVSGAVLTANFAVS